MGVVATLAPQTEAEDCALPLDEAVCVCSCERAEEFFPAVLVIGVREGGRLDMFSHELFTWSSLTPEGQVIPSLTSERSSSSVGMLRSMTSETHFSPKT